MPGCQHMPKKLRNVTHNPALLYTHTYTHTQLLLFPSLTLSDSSAAQHSTAFKFSSTGLKNTRLKKYCCKLTPPHTQNSSPCDANVIRSNQHHSHASLWSLKSWSFQWWRLTNGRLFCSVPNIMWTHLYSVLRSWNCTFAAACSWWRLTRAWGGVVPEMLICFLAEGTKGATKGWVRYPYLRGGASHRGSRGIQQASVTWLAGGESWEFISGQQTKTSQSLNLQTPQTQHKWWNWQ